MFYTKLITTLKSTRFVIINLNRCKARVRKAAIHYTRKVNNGNVTIKIFFSLLFPSTVLFFFLAVDLECKNASFMLSLSFSSNKSSILSKSRLKVYLRLYILSRYFYFHHLYPVLNPDIFPQGGKNGGEKGTRNVFPSLGNPFFSRNQFILS